MEIYHIIILTEENQGKSLTSFNYWVSLALAYSVYINSHEPSALFLHSYGVDLTLNFL